MDWRDHRRQARSGRAATSRIAMRPARHSHRQASSGRVRVPCLRAQEASQRGEAARQGNYVRKSQCGSRPDFTAIRGRQPECPRNADAPIPDASPCSRIAGRQPRDSILSLRRHGNTPGVDGPERFLRAGSSVKAQSAPSKMSSGLGHGKAFHAAELHDPLARTGGMAE